MWPEARVHMTMTEQMWPWLLFEYFLVWAWWLFGRLSIILVGLVQYCFNSPCKFWATGQVFGRIFNTLSALLEINTPSLHPVSLKRMPQKNIFLNNPPWNITYPKFHTCLLLKICAALQSGMISPVLCTALQSGTISPVPWNALQSGTLSLALCTMHY